MSIDTPISRSSNFVARPNPKESGREDVSLAALLGAGRRHLVDHRVQPVLDPEFQRRLDTLKTSFGSMGDLGVQGECAAAVFGAGHAPMKKLSASIAEVFGNALYDDVMSGHDVTYCVENVRGEVYAVAIDVTTDSVALNEKIRRLFVGEGTGDRLTRRLLPPRIKRGVFLPEGLVGDGSEDEEGLLFGSSVTQDEYRNQKTSPLPLIGYIDADFFQQEKLPLKAIEEMRDLFGLQLMMQARLVQGVACQWLQESQGDLPPLAEGLSSSDLAEYAQSLEGAGGGSKRLSRSDIEELLVMIRAADALIQAVKASFKKRYPGAETFLTALETMPQETLKTEDFLAGMQMLSKQGILEDTRRFMEVFAGRCLVLAMQAELVAPATSATQVTSYRSTDW